MAVVCEIKIKNNRRKKENVFSPLIFFSREMKITWTIYIVIFLKYQILEYENYIVLFDYVWSLYFGWDG